MGTPSSEKRFGINPVEIVLFMLTVAAFGYSVFNLVTFPSTDGSPLAMLSAEAANPRSIPTSLASMDSLTSPMSQSRAPASVNNHPILNQDLGCNEVQDAKTSASKVRLSGNLCDVPKLEGTAVLTTKITNTYSSKSYAATVFTDVGTGKFSTDYIPLFSGTNSIHVEFVYTGGKTFSKDFTITRN